MRARFIPIKPIAAAALLCCAAVHAQQAPAQLPTVEVVNLSPLPGLGVPKDQVPANVQTATAVDLERRQALDLSDYLGRALGSVNINAMQNNPFQPDINFRGFTASPLLGTPQGLSVYLDGVRMNQPFGDVVSWDLIPKSAIAKVALMPGSNPLFGLNTLGGALAVQTKDGLTDPGSSVQILGGSHSRAAAEFESGGGTAAFNWFVTGNRFHERGWRVDSPSDMSQIFGKLGGKIGTADVSLSLAAASNDLTGNGTQEQGALARDWSSVFTIPDNTKNRSQMLNLQVSQPLSQTLTLTGNAYYRRIHTNTFNGDLNDDAAGESLYQPNAGERAALTAAGYTGFPTSGENAANTPFPKWRCIAAVLLGDDGEPYEKCNGLINRTETNQRNYGFALQVSAKADAHLLLAGVAYDASRIRFNQSAQFGYLNPDRSITPLDSYADGSLVDDDDQPVDSRVDLSSRSHTTSVYASDTITLNPQTHLTLSGRYNRNTVHNRDGLNPGGGTGSLDGDHTFSHFNPAIGITFAPSPAFGAYAGVNQGSRAPSAIELGCADPASPCKLPNSFAGDPPLKQVITTTVEAGLRGTAGGLAWNVGVFRSDNKDDLLFVSDNAAGFGYFRNFGKTRRQGLELGLSAKPVESLTVGGNFTLLDATYRSPETVDGSSNSSNDAAQDGFPGQEGTIEIRPGDRIPNLPRRQLKLYADWTPGAQWHLGIDMTAMSGANARGNENGQYQADGTYYTGSGRSAGYALFNLDADWQPTPKVKLFAQISNLFDRKYSTGAQLGGNPFNAAGNYVARPLPRPAGADEFPAINGTFLAPGAPRAFLIGLRYSFD
ncbi:TonB-dependent receptor [Paucibacter sp. R3-3]|uniref:TonB-dependent receptor n=1 Tax=Roseateles agri TaxID=3098619 RepID=A0ABU5DRJ4_9BURK|nr:TonB-dependent receptor [Paucibacter sp. R3-3]MDY0748943.1 TonB-dependent receptor [Paucibacter sp. R3-3]